MIMALPSMELRKRIKRRKPNFVIKEAGYYPRIEHKWRFPRGRHSPARQYHSGKGELPNPGYGSPRAVRGLHSSGLAKVVVHTLRELQLLDPHTQGAVIGSTVGVKKRLALIEYALDKKIRVLNVKDAAVKKTELNAAFEQRRQVRRENIVGKQKKEEEKKKKADEKSKKEQAEKKKSSAGEELPNEEQQRKEEQLKREEQKELVEQTITKRQ